MIDGNEGEDEEGPNANEYFNDNEDGDDHNGNEDDEEEGKYIFYFNFAVAVEYLKKRVEFKRSGIMPTRDHFLH